MVYSDELSSRALSSFSKSLLPTSPWPSSTSAVWSMLRTPGSIFTVLYSLLASFEGTAPVPAPHRSGRLTFWFSPRSVSAMMLRVFCVVPVLFVTHISTRLMVTPVDRFGSVVRALS